MRNLLQNICVKCLASAWHCTFPYWDIVLLIFNFCSKTLKHYGFLFLAAKTAPSSNSNGYNLGERDCISIFISVCYFMMWQQIGLLQQISWSLTTDKESDVLLTIICFYYTD